MVTVLLQAIAACFGTIAFSIFFRVPSKHFPTCGAIGAVGWIVYLLVHNHTQKNMLAVLAAAMAVVFLSRFWSVRNRCPLISYLVPGIFPLVPGTGIFYTVFSAINGDYNMAVSSFVDAFKAAFAIAIAIITGIILPTRYIVKINNLLSRKK